MVNTVEDIIEMKNHTNNLGVNVYDWFFTDLENNYISKLNGTKRNVSIVENYDEESQAYIIQQLFYINKNAADELMKELKIVEPFVSNENYNHIIQTLNNN
ncbi:hypothetical protein [Oceanobacillus neutriphilus]|uniref:Uncharacterized protein n=1 Tax=Oceanobacillus neutriphilus TaxID=531815 RepID=A0ABQ2P2F5_9BACI|nr:hypothetical protein [Oceanobacillus neutriphilus]GGP16209.1 hypothetical protein GCM10011346_47270 [Oceanobacillus neutriphilus]